ncbi:MAG: hypothetical protein IJ242_12305, partial [Clostridia bacterium]|nr:hypothetical protein [Clostridia bacterium]
MKKKICIFLMLMMLCSCVQVFGEEFEEIENIEPEEWEEESYDDNDYSDETYSSNENVEKENDTPEQSEEPSGNTSDPEPQENNEKQEASQSSPEPESQNEPEAAPNTSEPQAQNEPEASQNSNEPEAQNEPEASQEQHEESQNESENKPGTAETVQEEEKTSEDSVTNTPVQTDPEPVNTPAGQENDTDGSGQQAPVPEQTNDTQASVQNEEAGDINLDGQDEPEMIAPDLAETGNTEPQEQQDSEGTVEVEMEIHLETGDNGVRVTIYAYGAPEDAVFAAVYPDGATRKMDGGTAFLTVSGTYRFMILDSDETVLCSQSRTVECPAVRVAEEPEDENDDTVNGNDDPEEIIQDPVPDSEDEQTVNRQSGSEHDDAEQIHNTEKQVNEPAGEDDVPVEFIGEAGPEQGNEPKTDRKSNFEMENENESAPSEMDGEDEIETIPLPARQANKNAAVSDPDNPDSDLTGSTEVDNPMNIIPDETRLPEENESENQDEDDDLLNQEEASPEVSGDSQLLFMYQKLAAAPAKTANTKGTLSGSSLLNMTENPVSKRVIPDDDNDDTNTLLGKAASPMTQQNQTQPDDDEDDNADAQQDDTK